MKRYEARPLLLLIGFAAAGMMLLNLQLAAAQDAGPCASDFKQYCNSVTPGGGRLVQCYEKNKDKMSGECRAWAEGAKAYAKVVTDACSKEIDQSCNIERGDPLAMLDCLQRRYTSMSPGCVSKLNEFKYRYPQVTRPPS